MNITSRKRKEEESEAQQGMAISTPKTDVGFFDGLFSAVAAATPDDGSGCEGASKKRKKGDAKTSAGGTRPASAGAESVVGGALVKKVAGVAKAKATAKPPVPSPTGHAGKKVKSEKARNSAFASSEQVCLQAHQRLRLYGIR